MIERKEIYLTENGYLYVNKLIETNDCEGEMF